MKAITITDLKIPIITLMTVSYIAIGIILYSMSISLLQPTLAIHINSVKKNLSIVYRKLIFHNYIFEINSVTN